MSTPNALAPLNRGTKAYLNVLTSNMIIPIFCLKVNLDKTYSGNYSI